MRLYRLQWFPGCEPDDETYLSAVVLAEDEAAALEIMATADPHHADGWRDATMSYVSEWPMDEAGLVHGSWGER